MFEVCVKWGNDEMLEGGEYVYHRIISPPIKRPICKFFSSFFFFFLYLLVKINANHAWA